jgi:hypothetical protein
MGGAFHTDALKHAHDHLLVVILIVKVDDLDLGLIDPVSRQFFVTNRLHVPFRSPVSKCAFQLGTVRISSSRSMSWRKETMRRTFSITAGCSPDASSLSINRRKPLWTTFLIFVD